METLTEASRIGARIQMAREAAGLTRQQLANLIGVSRTGVAHWECRGGSPSVENLAAVAQALSMPIESFLDEGDGVAAKLYALPPLLRAAFERDLTVAVSRADAWPAWLRDLPVPAGEDERRVLLDQIMAEIRASAG